MLEGVVQDMSRWRRQQRKRARRAREVGWLDGDLASDFDDCCKAIEKGLAEIRELTFKYEVRVFEAKLRRQAREQDEALRTG